MAPSTCPPLSPLALLGLRERVRAGELGVRIHEEPRGAIELSASDPPETLFEELYRLRHTLAAERSPNDISMSLGAWRRRIAEWRRDGSLRWLVTSDGTTPMSVELIEQAGETWVIHEIGWDPGVREECPELTSLALVELAAWGAGMALEDRTERGTGGSLGHEP